MAQSEDQFPNKLFDRVSKKVTSIQKSLDRQSNKYLQKLASQERKLRKKLAKTDSLAAAEFASNASARYKQLELQLQQLQNKGEYFPLLDTLKTSLNFLTANNQLNIIPQNLQGKVDASLTDILGLEKQLQKAEVIKQFIRERRNVLKMQFGQEAFSRQLRKLNKDAYYYHQAITEYKNLLNQPEKIERKAIDLLSKTKLFREFMKKNSLLASLFNFPDDPGSNAYLVNLAGLQTRTQVSQLVQQQLGGTASTAGTMMQQNIQQAQQQLRQLKDKAMRLGGGSGEPGDEMPDFKPNKQRTKTFLQRLELGTNLQSTKNNYFFPTTTDVALSVGYKANDKTIIGIGASYKIGWGKDITNIVVTGEGAGLRSFVDIKLKGSFHASSGYEYNYQPSLVAGSVAAQPKAWTQSGLVGISKVVSVKTKFFKKTRVQLLWDFLSYRQVPQTPAIKFRVGYIF